MRILKYTSEAIGTLCLALAGYFISLGQHTVSVIFLVLGLIFWGFGLVLKVQQDIGVIDDDNLTVLGLSALPLTESNARDIAIETNEIKESTMPKEDGPPSIDNRITNSPIVNSPGSFQVPGGHVTINQGAWLMTMHEQQTITQSLQAHAPATIQVLMIGDSDARKYASQIAYAINAAKWHVELVNRAVSILGAYGVHIQISNPELRATVISAFQAASIPTIVDPHIEPQFPNAILVGLKP